MGLHAMVNHIVQSVFWWAPTIYDQLSDTSSKSPWIWGWWKARTLPSSFLKNCCQHPYPYLLGRPHGLLLNKPQVECRGENEDQHGGRRGTWKRDQSWVPCCVTLCQHSSPTRWKEMGNIRAELACGHAWPSNCMASTSGGLKAPCRRVGFLFKE